MGLRPRLAVLGHARVPGRRGACYGIPIRHDRRAVTGDRDLDAVRHERHVAGHLMPFARERPEPCRLIVHQRAAPEPPTISWRLYVMLEKVILPPRISSSSRWWTVLV